MPDEPNNEPGQGQGGNPPAPSTGSSDKAFSQADLDRINAETRRKAEEAERKRVLEALGVEDVEAAKQIIADRKAADEAAKSELQRAQEERDQAKATAAEAMARAERTLISAEVRNALRDAGINPARIDGAIKLADLSEVKVNDGQVAGVDKVVEAVKTASPEWFGTGKRSAPDAGQGGGETFDYRTASPEEKDRRLRQLGVKRTTQLIRR